jgi:hypothetical protein
MSDLDPMNRDDFSLNNLSFKLALDNFIIKMLVFYRIGFVLIEIESLRLAEISVRQRRS